MMPADEKFREPTPRGPITPIRDPPRVPKTAVGGACSACDLILEPLDDADPARAT